MNFRILDRLLDTISWISKQLIPLDTALVSRLGLTITIFVIGLLTVLLVVLAAARFIRFLRAKRVNDLP